MTGAAQIFKGALTHAFIWQTGFYFPQAKSEIPLFARNDKHGRMWIPTCAV
jgi:hypothetical protein